MAIEMQLTRASSAVDELAVIAERWADTRAMSAGSDIATAGLGGAIGRLLEADQALSVRTAELVTGVSRDLDQLVGRARASDRW